MHPKSRLAAMTIVAILLALAVSPVVAPVVALAAELSLSGPCVAGASYDPACDADHDGDVDIVDIQLAAGHWNQTGTWTGGDYWSLTGNAGTRPGTDFLGTTDNQPLELRVAGQRALRLEPGLASPNVIGGHGGNSVTAGMAGATISGGGEQGYGNRVHDDFGTIGGGRDNQVGDETGALDGHYSTVAGGSQNTAMGSFATVCGGERNLASSDSSTVPGGSGAKTSHYGEMAYASGSFAAAGEPRPRSTCCAGKPATRP